MYNQVGDYCSALWIMDINGGNQQQVIPCAPNVGGAHEPKWSPDGKYIAYTQGFEDHDYKELYVVGFPATIKLPTRLTFNANYPHHNLQWLTTGVGWSALRNGSYILGSFRNEDPINGRTRNVAKVNTSTAAVTWLTDRTDAYCEQTPYPTTTGKVLFMSDIGGYGDIYIMNNDGTNKKQLTNTAVDGYCSNHPVMHPNGKYIAYRCEDPAAGGEWRICMMTADGKYKGIVVNDASPTCWRDATLKFNPAGTKLLYSGNAGCYPIELFTLNLDMADPDGDTLKNYEEVIYGTNIAAKDSDGGGENDYSEVNAGRNPLNPADDVVRAW
jgi:Tol biopolymer transport system component